MIPQAIDHARSEYPNESCGFVVMFKGREKYIACRNMAEDPLNDFLIAPSEWVRVSKIGDIVGVVHSHPNGNMELSPHDLMRMKPTGVPWIIINPVSGDYVKFQSEQTPLIGVPYEYGESDCYTLVQTYYKRYLGINLPDHTRGGTTESDASCIFDGLENDGFVKVETPEKHDLMFFNLSGDRPHHIGIYLGDNRILHHVRGRLSSRDTLTKLYMDRLWGCYRHLDTIT